MLLGVSKYCLTPVWRCSPPRGHLTTDCCLHCPGLRAGRRDAARWRQAPLVTTSCLRRLKKGSEWCPNVMKTLQHSSRETVEGMKYGWILYLTWILLVLKSKGIYIIQQSVASLHQILQRCGVQHSMPKMYYYGWGFPGASIFGSTTNCKIHDKES